MPAVSLLYAKIEAWHFEVPFQSLLETAGRRPSGISATGIVTGARGGVMSR